MAAMNENLSPDQVIAAQRAAHGADPHSASLGDRLNWLRAAVLGANDGIVSTAGLVVGVAAADPLNTKAIFTAALAGLLAGATSMALGEYVSVSTQRDTEKALITKEARELEETPAAEFAELVSLYRDQGLTEKTAEAVATELTANDPLKAHLRIELGIDQEELSKPWHAAGASALAFTVGALLPSLAILLTPGGPLRIPVTFLTVLIALFITGWLSAVLGGAPKRPAVLRVVVGGALAMAVTWLIGHLFGVSA